MIHTILFDLDDTLLDFQKAEANALKNSLLELNVQPTPEILKRYNIINLSQWKLLEKKLITRSELKTRRFQLLFDEFDISLDPSVTVQIYERNLSTGHYFLPGALEILKILSKNHALYLVSNGTLSVQKGRIASAGIESYFNAVFISEELGYNKPDIRFFQKCFEQIPNFSPEDTMIVGDSLSSDIKGGENAGIKTCWYNPSKATADLNVRIDYEISDLMQLKDICS